MTTALTPLTPRQRAVLEAVADGLTCREIANRLHISKRTVERHIETIADKLGGEGPRMRRLMLRAAELLRAEAA